MVGYGLVGIGGGFFTLKHKVLDITAEINKIYMRIDLLPKRIIINMISKRLANNAELILKQIGETRQKVRGRDMDQEDAGDLLSSVYQLSEMGRFNEINYTPNKLGLLYGVDRILLGEYIKWRKGKKKYRHYWSSRRM